MLRSSIVVASFVLALSVAPALAEPVKSSADDQKEISLTVYNSNIGLVKDVRQLTLPSGQGELRFMDVASAIMPETVRAKSLTAPDKLAVLEQNYEYDLINRKKLLDKYVGQTIKLLDFNPYQDKKETVEAKLIANNDGEVYEINGEIFLGHPGVSVLPRIPENLIAKPTLAWLYSSGIADSQDIEVSYMTRNVNWHADYVLTLDKDDKLGDLGGWVTIDNQSGATYKDAVLKVVAGKVNMAPVPQRMRMQKAEMPMMMDSAGGAPQFGEQAFFEYHLYDLKRKTTIKDKQTKQISLLEAGEIPLKKEFVIEGQGGWWYTQQFNDPLAKQPVNVTMSFKNSEADHLGMPLPAGIIRLYKKDRDGSAQFIGEDNIIHTPKDEEVRLKVGEAFDVVAERKQTAFQRVSNKTFESSWEIKLRNHKTEDVTVYVVEPLAGFSDWEILQNSYPFTKLDASRVRFEVPVPKDGEAVLTYTAQVNYM